MSDNRRRRKSLSIFRPSLTALTPIDDEPPDSAPAILKKRRAASFFQDNSPSSNSTVLGVERTNSKSGLDRIMPRRPRPRSLQKTGRPTSVFGSFRSLSSLHDEDEELTRTTSSPSSLNSTSSLLHDVAAGMIIHHGPLPEAGPMFRRKCPYLVLTENHLIQFKSQNRASETFPKIPSLHSQSRAGNRHSRLSSSSSTHDLQSSPDGYQSIPLLQVVAVYKLDDGEPYFSIEIAHLNDNNNNASTMTLQIHDPRDSDTWLSAIQSAASKSRSTHPSPLPQGLVEYAARALEQENDYDPNHFRMFKVVQRANKSGKRSSSDDLTKLTSKVCILAIGVYKIHLVPLPKATRTASSTSLSDMAGASYGIVTLTSLKVHEFDDSFQLWFRQPFQPASALYLAALCAQEIALWIRQAAEYLRPEWTEQPFHWSVPQCVNEEALPSPADEEEENHSFDRTLTAYCAAYGIDTSTIRYTVNALCEDEPCFVLLPTGNARRSKYSSLELLAIMRALRFNESFNSISFRHVILDVLHGLHDQHGWEHVPWTTRSGQIVELPNQQDKCVMIQEIRALAINSKRLRRLDFSYSIIRKPSTAGASADGGCGICEALFPICGRQLTNVDWIALNGIVLSESDVEFLFAAAIEKSCHFRAIELGSCGLEERRLQSVLQALSHQGATLESIDLSGNPARHEPADMRGYLKELSFIRKINLCGAYRTSRAEPFIDSSTLLLWRLEELDVSRTSINAETVTAIAEYLRSPQSNAMRVLSLNACGLTGGNVADLLQAMHHGEPRPIHLYITENHLEQDHDKLVDAVKSSLTPTCVTMEMLEYKEETNFRQLVQAWTQNKSTKYLNMSKVSLPFEASSETSVALENMLAENQSIETLNISGEEAHLEVANFGSGLNKALTGLKSNTHIEVLHVEHQRLGMQGANTLASVLEVNVTLKELHCACNGFSLQAFTVLVNSLKDNTTLLYLPFMANDRAAAIRKVDREIDHARENNPRGLMMPTKATVSNVKKSISAAMPRQRLLASRVNGNPSPSKKPSNGKETFDIVGSISDNWDREIGVLQGYLQRNYNLANGRDPEALRPIENERPLTAWSTATAVRFGSNEVTPVGEPDRQLVAVVGDEDEDEDDGLLDDYDDDDMDGALMMSKKLDLG